MRLVCTADLHGDIDSYRELLELAAQTDARAAIVAGDLLPHAIRVDTALQVQREFVIGRLRPLLAEFYASYPRIGVYLLAGNDDWAAAIHELDALEADRLAWPLHERVYNLADFAYTDGTQPAVETLPGDEALWIAGYACVPVSPFSIKDYERTDTSALPQFSFQMAYTSRDGAIRPVSASEIAALPSIAADLQALAARSDPARTIYVCHAPPAHTPLDQMARNRHIGSRAVRGFIEQHAPLLTLHGHIHEAPELSGQYAVQIGKTWCVNPGHDPLHFQAVAFDTDDIAGTLNHTVLGRPIA